MKILVTGGAGYIGTVLIPMLLEKNISVTTVDNYLFNQKFNFQHKNLKLINGDVTDYKLIEKILKDRFDYIVPLAGLVGAPLCDLKPNKAKEVNEKAIEFLCQNIDIDTKIIVPTTNSGYGIGKKKYILHRRVPFKSDFCLWCNKSKC